MNPSIRSLKQRSDNLQRSMKTLDKAEFDARKAQTLLLEALVEAVTTLASKVFGK